MVVSPVRFRLQFPVQGELDEIPDVSFNIQKGSALMVCLDCFAVRGDRLQRWQRFDANAWNGHCYGIDQRPAELHATQWILHTRIRYGAFRAGAYRPACG